MPRPKSAVPKYCLHKPSGRAYVRINRRTIYLGEYNSPESKEQYQRLLAENPNPAKSLVIPKGEQLTIAGLIAKYVEEAPQTDTCPDRLKSSIRPLLELYATLPAQEFSPKKLIAVRNRIIELGNRNHKHKKTAHKTAIEQGDKQAKNMTPEEVFVPLASSTVNPLIKKLVRVFRWAANQELIPAEVWHGLLAVENIKRNEARQNEKLKPPKKVKPVPVEHIDAILPHVLPEVAAMIQLQLVCPLRPDEITIMRPADIDTKQDPWQYTITSRDNGGEGHKTDWHDGEDKIIFIGPKAQTILTPWLAACPDRGAFLFSPKRAVMLQHDRRRKRPMRVKEWRRLLHDRYNDDSYRRAIARACEAAKIPKWSPNQLRHNGATNITEEIGIEAASAALGHKNIKTTQIYAEKSIKLQREVAMKMG